MNQKVELTAPALMERKLLLACFLLRHLNFSRFLADCALIGKQKSIHKSIQKHLSLLNSLKVYLNMEPLLPF